jgi:hypothetical protein
MIVPLSDQPDNPIQSTERFMGNKSNSRKVKTTKEASQPRVQRLAYILYDIEEKSQMC